MTGEAVRDAQDAAAPAEGGSVRFHLSLDGVAREAFVVRVHGERRAYVNTCRHQSLALDGGGAPLLDPRTGEIVCAHHGARYDAASGACVSGPCRGAFLTALALEERDDGLWCVGRAARPRDS